MAAYSQRSMMSSSRLAPARGRSLAVAVQARAAKTTAAMVCIDCGYIYDGKQGDFASLPNNYKCPVCDSSKRRFKAATGRVARGNDPKTMRARREALRQQLEESGEDVGGEADFLYYTFGGTVALLGLFYFLAQNR